MEHSSALLLQDPVTRIGSQLLDCTTCVTVTIPAAPPRASKVFDQWAQAWIQNSYRDCKGKTVVGSDGSYKIKGQGISAFVVQHDNVMVATDS